jgi:hypothetical protein
MQQIHNSSCEAFIIMYANDITFGLNLEQLVYNLSQMWLHLHNNMNNTNISIFQTPTIPIMGCIRPLFKSSKLSLVLHSNVKPKLYIYFFIWLTTYLYVGFTPFHNNFRCKNWESSLNLQINPKKNCLVYLVAPHYEHCPLQSIFSNSISSDDIYVKTSKVSNFKHDHMWHLITLWNTTLFAKGNLSIE